MDEYWVVMNQFCVCRIIRAHNDMASHEHIVFRGTYRQCRDFQDWGDR